MTVASRKCPSEHVYLATERIFHTTCVVRKGAIPFSQLVLVGSRAVVRRSRSLRGFFRGDATSAIARDVLRVAVMMA